MSNTCLSLFKRANGFWYISYLADGRIKWKSTGKKLKPEAFKLLTEFEEFLRNSLPKMSFSEFRRQFELTQVHHVRKATMRSYLASLKTFERICGSRTLDCYTLADVETFKRKRLETVKPTSLNIEFRSLKTAFNLAVKWQLITDNPFLKSQQVKVVERLPVYITQEEFPRFLKIVNEEVLRDVFLLAVLTGCRLGEILHLQWRDVDIVRRQLLVENRGGFETKSGKCRCIPVNDQVVEMLSRRLIFQNVSQWVFHRQGVRLNGSYVSHSFKRYARQYGFAEQVHFHSLRHTFATWCVQSGVQIYSVQKLLGHSSVKMTEVYSHLAASELHGAVNRISFPLN